jgi:hypothetical protein
LRCEIARGVRAEIQIGPAPLPIFRTRGVGLQHVLERRLGGHGVGDRVLISQLTAPFDHEQLAVGDRIGAAADP